MTSFRFLLAQTCFFQLKTVVADFQDLLALQPYSSDVCCKAINEFLEFFKANIRHFFLFLEFISPVHCDWPNCPHPTSFDLNRWPVIIWIHLKRKASPGQMHAHACSYSCSRAPCSLLVPDDASIGGLVYSGHDAWQICVFCFLSLAVIWRCLSPASLPLQ
jgi:hypothetical protein